MAAAATEPIWAQSVITKQPTQQPHRRHAAHWRTRNAIGYRRRRRQLAAVTPDQIMVTTLIPAHNEEDQISATLESLLAQTRLPDTIIVVADNCTDNTVKVASQYPVKVITTEGNRHRKAGALNQVLDKLLPQMTGADAVLVMDADSVLDAGFVEHAVRRLASGEVAAVGGTFTGKPGGGLVGVFQRNEYARYARDVRRLKGKALVLTGTAAVYRATVLTEVAEARAAQRLPGKAHVYDTHILTEDNELTLAVLHLGYRIVAPAQCTLTTEVMPTWRALFRQRLRWKRGALENLKDYGWTSVTLQYWARQALLLLGIIVITAYLSTLVISLVVFQAIAFSPVWTTVTLIFAVERAITVRQRGPLMMALGAVIVVEMVYDLFLQAAQATAFWQAATHAERRW